MHNNRAVPFLILYRSYVWIELFFNIDSRVLVQGLFHRLQPYYLGQKHLLNCEISSFKTPQWPGIEA